MEEIKIGDWVISKHNSIYQYTEHSYIGVIKEKWIPKHGELCWFYNIDDKHNTLAKYNLTHNKKHYTIELVDSCSFDICEPYIKNQLPTNIIK